MSSSTAEPTGDAQEVTAESFSFDAGNETPAESTEQTSQDAANSPPWSEYLSQFPDAFHSQLEETFKTWDSKVNSRFQQKAQEYQQQLERYKPFDPFLENGLTPQHLQAAQAIINELSTNPKGLYERLGQHLGITPEQAKEVVDQQKQEGEEFDAETGQFTDPRLDELLQWQQQTEEFLRQQHEAEMQRRADSAIEKEMGDLQTKYSLSPPEMQEVLMTAAHLARQNPNVTLEQAFQNWDQRKRALFAQSPGVNAPSVVPANGGNPVTPRKSYADMTPEEFNADTVAALKNLSS